LVAGLAQTFMSATSQAALGGANGDLMVCANPT